jgi:hypothetical protein
MPKYEIDNDFCRLEHIAEHKVVHHQVKKFIFGQALRDLLMAGCKLMEERRATKWLSDDSKNGAIPADDAEWATTVWFPKVKAAGWKYWAIVPPTKAIGQMSLTRFAELYGGHGVEVKAFANADEALAWLKSVD